jgi:hypothetical protein
MSSASISSLITQSESIKSRFQRNEKMAKIPSDGKFSTIIDDGKASRCERLNGQRHPMMKQEINNFLSKNRSASDDANESIGVTGNAVPQEDESFAQADRNQ